jgi:hypothetical protein
MKVSKALRPLAHALALAACVHVTPASAADAASDVQVSRITMNLQGSGWTVSGKLPYALAIQDQGLSIDGERRVIGYGLPGTSGSMVMLVSATRGTSGATVHADCDPDDRFYVRKFNRGISTYIPLQCLRVQGPVSMPRDLSVFGETLAVAFASQRARLPDEGYVLSLLVCNENGAIVEIFAFIGTDFAGLQARPAVDFLPPGLPAGVAAWADKLAEESLGTLSSWSGRMTVPPVVFTPPPAPPLPAGVKIALAAPAAMKD